MTNNNRDNKADTKSFGVAPKGCIAVMVGCQGEEQQRFIVPLLYINHPLFVQLLKEAEEVYGFDHSGPIKIPCHVEEFKHVSSLINIQQPHNHYYPSWCFRT